MSRHNGSFQGTSQDDTFAAYKRRGGRLIKRWGNWNINGWGGNDRLFGGAKSDWIAGQTGNDYINGGDGDDYLFGDYSQVDHHHFGHSADSYAWQRIKFLANGNDEIYGGKGNDQIFGGGGNDRLYGGENDDQIWGEWGNDSLVGGQGNDRLYGGSGNDVLSGEQGNDVLIGGGGGIDILAGGSGNDTFVLDDDYLGDGHAVILDYAHFGRDFIRLEGWGRNTEEIQKRYVLTPIYGSGRYSTYIYDVSTGEGDLVAVVKNAVLQHSALVGSVLE